MKTKYFIVLFTLGLFGPLLAQDKVWTMNDCMQYAIKNSSSVKKQQYTADSYMADRNAAVASFFLGNFHAVPCFAKTGDFA